MTSIEYSRSGEYRKHSRRLSGLKQRVEHEVKKLPGDIDINPEFVAHVELTEARREVLESIERATGRRFHVITDSDDKQLAGLAKIHTGESFIRESTLDDPEEALHIAVHEALHHKALAVLDIQEAIGEQLMNVLDERMHSTIRTQLSEVNLVEGFVEQGTTDKVGHWADCAYHAEEVPAAQALDDLAREHGIFDLKAVFLQGEREGFNRRLQQVAEAELSRQAA